jgi:hypothetical protein
MKLSTGISLLGLGLGVAGFAISNQGCSSDDTPSGGGAKVGQPPAPPSGAAASDTPARNFALFSIGLGEADRSGATNPNAWKKYGYNLDGVVTSKSSTDVCKLAPGASSATQEDGDDGIDNSFGKNILPILQNFASTPSKTINESLQDGSFTIMLEIKGLTDDPKQTNIGLGGRLLVGANFKGPDGKNAKPTFTAADDWPYRAEPIVPINGAYITNGTFVNGSGGAVVKLALVLQGVSLDLTINRAIITFDHTAPSEITNGTIAGVVSTKELEDGITKVAGRISPSLCQGGTLDSILNTIRQASDINGDGTNKAGASCDAISIGLAFTGKQIGAPNKVAEPDPPSPDPCTNPPADAGTDSGGGGTDSGSGDAATD